MARAGGSREQSKGNETHVKLEDDLDALFKLPLTEFTVARNALAARLKKTGSGDEAERVKALAKPSISAWAVNQLYWKHRDEFNGLIAAGERFRMAHASQLAGKAADLRGPLAARREALSALSRVAGALLSDAGHNPTPDTMRRITATLEALSAYSSFSDAPSPGRLTDDVAPPGFESLAALIPSVGQAESPDPSPRAIPFQPSASVRKEERQARIVSAKSALQAAERALHETRTMVHDLAAALKKATAHANETEKDRREAEERFKKASAAAEEAGQRLHSVAAEAEKAARVFEDAERAVEKARNALKEETSISQTPE